MGRILAIDYGRRRVGLAVSDPLKLFAQGLPTLLIEKPADIIAWVNNNKEAQEFERIVLGLPRSLSGDQGPMAQEVTEFARQLEDQTQIPVLLVDERMSSSEAHAAFAQSGKKLKGNKETIDKIAAVIILQSYLETLAKDNDVD